MSTHHSTETHLDLRPLEEVDTGTNRSSSACSSGSGVKNRDTHTQRDQLPIINRRKDFVRQWEYIQSNRLTISFPVEFATDRSPARWLERINEKSHKWPKSVLRCTQFTQGSIFIVEMPSVEHSAVTGFITDAVSVHCALPFFLKAVSCGEQTLQWLQRANGTHPTPDIVISPGGSISPAPSFVVEVGFSEGRDSLEKDAALYLAHGVNVLLLHIPDKRKKVQKVVHNPALTQVKYDMWYRLQTSINGVGYDSDWVPFGNRGVGFPRRCPCKRPNQVTLDIPTAALFENAPPHVPGQPHWTQLPVNLTIDCWDLQQYIISEVKRVSGYV